MECFWKRCSDSERCQKFGQCVASWQNAHKSAYAKQDTSTQVSHTGGDAPRTDAKERPAGMVPSGLDVVLSDFARSLERELTDARLALSLTRSILAGADAGSLPNDFPVDGMAAERMKDLLNTRRELAEADGKLTYLRSTRAGEMGEKLYKLEQELAELREELRLRHEADVKASVTHTSQAASGTPRDGVTGRRDGP